MSAIHVSRLTFWVLVMIRINKQYNKHSVPPPGSQTSWGVTWHKSEVGGSSMSHSHRCVPINWCHMQWLTIGGPHYNSDFTDVYDYGILLLCVFREGILGGMNLNLGSIHSFLFGRHHWTVYVETDGENEEFRLNRLDLFYPCQISTAVWVWSVGLFTKKTGNYLEQK